ncbi:MAG: ankyrin repeat domain-containing protein [Pseudomonadales bacterium]|jgi:ankyrin repeat protein|nr:ankyrin repeat domain-containing protein [Pseudomonadales bacterium]
MMYRKTAIALALTLSFGTTIAQAAHELADAVMNEDRAAIEALLEQGADVNDPQLDDSTALHYAAYQDDVDLARRLVEAGADVEAVTRLGATPLYLAAVNGSAEMISVLLANGVDPNVTVLSHNETPLMFAARSGSVESVRLLLDAGADMEAKDDYRGATPLLFAAEQNHAEVVRLLAERGANLNARTSTEVTAGRRGPSAPSGGLSALMLAAREGGLATIEVLLKHHAMVNQQSAEGHTALLAAIQNANVDIANLLIDAGADVSLANDRGWNPLYMAVKMRSLEKGTMPNPVVDMDGMYALIERMLDGGANVNARLLADTEVHNSIRSTWLDEAGGTPFLRASLCADLKVMKLLLAHGADPLIATTDGTTALAALAGVGYTKGFMHDVGSIDESIEAMQMLIDAGIDLNAKNDDEVAAIHGAAHKNFVQGIQLLVDSGADLTAHSNRRGQFQRADGIAGNTVLDWADGFQTGMESAIYNAEAVVLVEKLLNERGLPLERLAGTIGGRVAQQQ